MFYNGGDSYEANSRENTAQAPALREHRPYENLASAETSQAKLFADAYSHVIPDIDDSRCRGELQRARISPRVDAIDPYKNEQRMKEEIREMILYRQQLIEAERRLLAEIYFMAAIYMTGMYRYYHHHLSGNFHHLSNNFRHWVRPRYWLHEAEKTGAVGARFQRPRGILVMLSGLAAESKTYIRPLWHVWSQAGTNLAGRLITDARHSIGQPVWAFTRFASVCQAGNLGCAATVSELLQESGVRIPGSAGVYGLVDQLSAAGWQRIKISDKQQFRPGDVVFGVRGPHGHIGIISDTNNGRVLVCDNSSSSGTLKERTIESGGAFTPNGRFAGSLYVMRQSSG